VQELLNFKTVMEWVMAGTGESWRDGPHEADMVAHGVITEDLRARPLVE
jgi:hypothetical protein